MAVGTGTITRTLPSVPAVTESVTITEAGHRDRTLGHRDRDAERDRPCRRDAAAAGAAAGSADEDGLTSSEWGWVAFGALAVAVLVGGIVVWLRRRSAAKTA